MNTLRFIEHMLLFRNKNIELLYKRTKQFMNRHVDYFVKKLTQDLDNNEKILREAYGGSQYHVKSQDSQYMQNNYGYIDMHNTCLINQHSTSQSTIILNHSIQYSPKLESSSQQEVVSCFKPKLFGRYCDSKCNIPKNWASLLNANFQLFTPICNYKILQNNIILFEKCEKCYASPSKECQPIELCSDNFRVLLMLLKHYQSIRSILRFIYSIRSINLSLIELDNYLLPGDVEFLTNLTQYNHTSLSHSKPVCILRNVPNILSEKRLKMLKISLKKEMEKKLSQYECISCHRIFIKDRVTLLKGEKLNNSIFIQLKEGFDWENFYMCREQCYKQLYTQQQTPVYSKLNNMFFQAPPEAISSLNLYESMLCRKAKCFQTIINLQQHRKNPNTIKAVGLKGLAIHLPITFEETHDFLKDSTNVLPNIEAFNIIVNGLPTKTGNIWSSLVDMKKVYKALYWLLDHNHLYEHVDIILDLDKRISPLLFGNNQIIFNKDIIEQASYLASAKEEFLAQYPVIDLDKVNENKTDIEKFQCKRIKSVPIQDRAIHKDHLCFVELYSTDHGGMYDKRNYEVKPAMYIRLIIQQAIPHARRNIQFILSSLHNKDIRAADNGIYASLHASKMPGIKAGFLKQQIKDNSHVLETNLKNTLTAVRGSAEYWTSKCSDLICMDEKFDCAQWFATFSYAEYQDEALHEYLIQMNSDLNEVNHMKLDKLIQIDPVSVSTFFEKKI